jgi:GT2 family glycosyltransferase
MEVRNLQVDGAEVRGMSEADAVVVNYNSEAYLARCLRALSSQEGLRNVVVIDNGPSGRGVEALVSGRPRARLISNRRNVGFGRACNQGFRITTADWVLIVNPDCELAPGALPTMISCAEAHYRAAMVGPRLYNPDGGLQTSAYRLPTLVQSLAHLFGLKRLVPVGLLRKALGRVLGKAFGQFSPHDTETEVEMVTGACALIRRAALTQVGLFDPTFFVYNEEKDWCERARRLGWEIWFTPAAAAVHAIGRSISPDSADAFRHRSMGMLRFYAKHRGQGSLRILRVAVAVAAACKLLTTLGRGPAALYRQTAREAMSYSP